jgi:hypothetical protein
VGGWRSDGQSVPSGPTRAEHPPAQSLPLFLFKIDNNNKQIHFFIFLKNY